MAATIEIQGGAEAIKAGMPVKIIAMDSSAPSSTFDITIQRRRYDASRSLTTDPVIESATVSSDDTGLAVFNWSWSTANLAATGSTYRYYPTVSIDGSAKVAPVDTTDIICLDSTDALLYGVTVSLGPVQAIPVYAEVSKDSGVSETRTIFDFTWDNWRTGYAPVVFQLSPDAETEVTPTDYTVDYRNGKLTFNSTVPGYVEVEASYVFGYYSEQELRQFLSLAVLDLNYAPPYTSYTINSYPDYWESMIVSGATLRCLEQLMLAPLFRERKLIFSDEDLISNISGYYERLKTDFAAAVSKKNRWSLVAPYGISGHDVMAPPRTTAHNFQQYAYLRGRGY